MLLWVRKRECGPVMATTVKVVVVTLRGEWRLKMARRRVLKGQRAVPARGSNLNLLNALNA